MAYVVEIIPQEDMAPFNRHINNTIFADELVAQGTRASVALN